VFIKDTKSFPINLIKTKKGEEINPHLSFRKPPLTFKKQN
jgi:hypothetical protein